MHPTTAALLASISALREHARVAPTDKAALDRLRKVRVQAEHDWGAAGEPDSPRGPRVSGPPLPVPGVTSARPGEDHPGEGKDWNPVVVTLDILRLTDGGAAQCSDGIRTVHAPVALLWEPGTREPANLVAGDCLEVAVPRWLAVEKEWVAR